MTPHHTAAQAEEPLVEGRPELAIADAVRETIAEALADLLLAALEREDRFSEALANATGAP